MVKKKFWLFLILAIFVLGGGWWWGRKPAVKEEPIELKEAGQVSLILDFGEEKLSTYSASLEDPATVLEVLTRVAKEDDFNLETRTSDFGVLVEEIGGKANTKDQFWLYYVNGKMGEVGADKYQLKAGDVVEWRYKKN